MSPMKKLLNRLFELFGKEREYRGNEVDAEGYKIGLYSRILNNNDPIIYSTPKMRLDGFYIRGNPDGSEDLMRLGNEGYAFIKKLCDPGKGKFSYLITKASRNGKYEYLKNKENWQ